jgi:hypothetical protein
MLGESESGKTSFKTLAIVVSPVRPPLAATLGHASTLAKR